MGPTTFLTLLLVLPFAVVLSNPLLSIHKSIDINKRGGQSGLHREFDLTAGRRPGLFGLMRPEPSRVTYVEEQPTIVEQRPIVRETFIREPSVIQEEQFTISSRPVSNIQQERISYEDVRQGPTIVQEEVIQGPSYSSYQQSPRVVGEQIIKGKTRVVEEENEEVVEQVKQTVIEEKVPTIIKTKTPTYIQETMKQKVIREQVPEMVQQQHTEYVTETKPIYVTETKPITVTENKMVMQERDRVINEPGETIITKGQSRVTQQQGAPSYNVIDERVISQSEQRYGSQQIGSYGNQQFQSKQSYRSPIGKESNSWSPISNLQVGQEHTYQQNELNGVSYSTQGQFDSQFNSHIPQQGRYRIDNIDANRPGQSNFIYRNNLNMPDDSERSLDYPEHNSSDNEKNSRNIQMRPDFLTNTNQSEILSAPEDTHSSTNAPDISTPVAISTTENPDKTTDSVASSAQLDNDNLSTDDLKNGAIVVSNNLTSNDDSTVGDLVVGNASEGSISTLNDLTKDETNSILTSTKTSTIDTTESTENDESTASDPDSVVSISEGASPTSEDFSELDESDKSASQQAAEISTDYDNENRFRSSFDESGENEVEPTKEDDAQDQTSDAQAQATDNQNEIANDFAAANVENIFALVDSELKHISRSPMIWQDSEMNLSNLLHNYKRFKHNHLY